MESADCPECKNGKHDNCDGVALNPVTDVMDQCTCESLGHGFVNIFDASPAVDL